MKTVLLYSKDYCPYCVAAKNLLSVKNIPFVEKDANAHSAEFFALAEKHEHQTVPMIFIEQAFVGGFDDLKALSLSGKLEEMLA